MALTPQMVPQPQEVEGVVGAGAEKATTRQEEVENRALAIVQTPA